MGSFFVVFSACSVFALEDLYRNKYKSANVPQIVLSHKDTASEGELVHLDASKSFDPDGDPLKFSWKKLSPDHYNIVLSNDNSAVVSFVAPPVKNKAIVLLGLSVTDGNGNTDIEQFHLTISKNTEENKRQNQQADERSTFTMNKDRAQKHNTKPLDLSPQSNYKDGQSVENPVKSLSLGNNKIKVNAGKDVIAVSDDTVNLHGTIVSNSDSKQIKISWTQKKGPLMQLSSSHILNPNFVAPNVKEKQIIMLELVASDQSGIIDTDNMNIVILPEERKVADNTEAKDKFLSKHAQPPETSSDATQPVVVRTNPSDGSKGISTTSKITATFSEPVLSSSITTSTFTVKASGSSTNIPGVVGLSRGIEANFTPLSALHPSTTYVAALTTRVKDLEGNSLNVLKTWSFTTDPHNGNTVGDTNRTSAIGSENPISNESAGFTTAALDTTRPTVTSTSPASGATGVAVSSRITATFSEPVQSWSSLTIFTVKNSAGTSFPGTLALSTDRKTVTFSHSSLFAPSTSYTVTISTGVKDIAGNTMTSAKTWSFTTAVDTTAPSVKITSPASNSAAASNTITVAGTSSDSGSGIKSVMVRIRSATTTTGYTLATPKAPSDWSTWSVSLSLSSAGPTGPYFIEARAEDKARNLQWSDDVIVKVTAQIDFSDSFSTPYSFTQDGQISPDGKWKMKYLSGGKTAVANEVLTTYPATATTSTKTFSTLVTSTQKFHNFQLDFDMRTNKQMRTGTSPKSWETAWLFFRYTDERPSNHHYWFLLKTDGYQFGKKDNAPGDSTTERQIFLKEGQSPAAKIGSFQHITVKAVNYRFTISVGGQTVVDMIDPKINDPSKMSEGVLGLYEEDSSASFDNIKLTKLP